MATRHQFDKPARRELLDQLQAAGVAPDRVLVEFDGGPGGAAGAGTTCWVTCEDADLAAVRSVVAAHDAAAIDAAAAQEAQADSDDRGGAWAARAQLAAERDLLADTTKAIALADVRRILLLVVRVQLAILRYLHRRGL